MAIEWIVQKGVGTLWLARPDKRNAFTGEMLTTISDTLKLAESDPAVRVVVIAGRGKVFCAGADLGWMAAQALEGPAVNLESAMRMGGVFHSISNCRKPTIARVHGAAMGGGVGIASACDFVIASQAAAFALSEVRLGLVPGVISPFVVRRVGPAKARSLFMLGGKVTGAQAVTIGLADECVVDDDALDEAIGGIVSQLVMGGPEALYGCKTLVDGVQYRDPGDVLAFTAEAISGRRASSEAQEGMMAFLQKRPASWIPGADEVSGDPS